METPLMTKSTPSFAGFESDILSLNTFRFNRRERNGYQWRLQVCFEQGLDGLQLVLPVGQVAQREMVRRWDHGRICRECIIGVMGK